MLNQYLPILTWGKSYNRKVFIADVTAAVIVTVMLIPQSMAYALLAGLPPEAGIYASIAPIVLYSIFGTSTSLAVGPVAVLSLMTATTIGAVTADGSVDYVSAALTLAFLSGAMLLLFGVFRFGFLANYLSHPVIAGFITASGIIIALSQLKHLLGINAEGHNIVELVVSLFTNLSQTNLFTLVLGFVATVFLFWARFGLPLLLRTLNVKTKTAELIVKVAPVVAIVGTTLCVWFFQLSEKGVDIVGDVPQTLPPFTVPVFSLELTNKLLLPALLLSLIGFVESISVARTLAAKKRQRIDPNQELIGLGAANVGAAFTSGFPVTGGFARSVVNYDAGATTPAAGAFTAVGLAVAAVALTPFLFYLPKAALAATIVVAVTSLINLKIIKQSWQYSKADFAAVTTTILLTLIAGVEIGISSGVIVSLLLLIHKTSRPHVAEVGLVPGTQHFRNIVRHDVITDPRVLTLRIDESLNFSNTQFLSDYLYNRIAPDENIGHVVLMCSAVNEIDMSALETLESISLKLKQLGIILHLSEVKGPVMDRLGSSHFLEQMEGEVFLSQYDAYIHSNNVLGDIVTDNSKPE